MWSQVFGQLHFLCSPVSTFCVHTKMLPALGPSPGCSFCTSFQGRAIQFGKIERRITAKLADKRQQQLLVEASAADDEDSGDEEEDDVDELIEEGRKKGERHPVLALGAVWSKRQEGSRNIPSSSSKLNWTSDVKLHNCEIDRGMHAGVRLRIRLDLCTSPSLTRDFKVRG